MTENYNDVKRACEAGLHGLLRTIYSELSEEDAEKLCFELALSCFVYPTDYSKNIDYIMKKQIKN